jgi:hypothetical protein
MLKSIGLLFLRRWWILLSLCLITPLGFWFKFYDGPGRWWFNDYGGGVAYEIFWCLVAFFFWPRKKDAAKIAVWVFAITCVLETLQLWHPPFLEHIRVTFAGKAIIGTTFVWWDFPHYALGSFIGWLWISCGLRFFAFDRLSQF